MREVEAPRVVLDASDRDSRTWAKIERHLEGRLARLRLDNDNDHDYEKTAKLRGQIAEVKALLSLGRTPVTLADQQ